MNIAEFARRVGVSTDTVRYYERLGLMMPVARQSNGYRRFAETDVEWVHFLHRLRDTGMSQPQMIAYARLHADGERSMDACRRMLEAHVCQLRAGITRQQTHLRRLNQRLAQDRLRSPRPEPEAA